MCSKATDKARWHTHCASRFHAFTLSRFRFTLAVLRSSHAFTPPLVLAPAVRALHAVHSRQHAERRAEKRRAGLESRTSSSLGKQNVEQATNAQTGAQTTPARARATDTEVEHKQEHKQERGSPKPRVGPRTKTIDVACFFPRLQSRLLGWLSKPRGRATGRRRHQPKRPPARHQSLRSPRSPRRRR